MTKFNKKLDMLKISNLIEKLPKDLSYIVTEYFYEDYYKLRDLYKKNVKMLTSKLNTELIKQIDHCTILLNSRYYYVIQTPYPKNFDKCYTVDKLSSELNRF